MSLLPHKEEYRFKRNIAESLLVFREADKQTVQTLLDASKAEGERAQAEIKRAQAEIKRAQAELMLAAARTQYFSRLFDVAAQNVTDARLQIQLICLDENGLGGLSRERAQEAESAPLPVTRPAIRKRARPNAERWGSAGSTARLTSPGDAVGVVNVHNCAEAAGEVPDDIGNVQIEGLEEELGENGRDAFEVVIVHNCAEASGEVSNDISMHQMKWLKQELEEINNGLQSQYLISTHCGNNTFLVVIVQKSKEASAKVQGSTFMLRMKGLEQELKEKGRNYTHRGGNDAFAAVIGHDCGDELREVPDDIAKTGMEGFDPELREKGQVVTGHNCKDALEEVLDSTRALEMEVFEQELEEKVEVSEANGSRLFTKAHHGIELVVTQDSKEASGEVPADIQPPGLSRN
ncbi:hypothetical protein C8R46DRAFT_1034637 [Mycena filopes]|nr:hypothetical protein C8R46DRAFT_1034637 [Mycena filopes]